MMGKTEEEEEEEEVRADGGDDEGGEGGGEGGGDGEEGGESLEEVVARWEATLGPKYKIIVSIVFYKTILGTKIQNYCTKVADYFNYHHIQHRQNPHQSPQNSEKDCWNIRCNIYFYASS